MSEKLQKVLASQGLGGRRTMEQWIESGRVTINGRRAQLGDRVELDDRVTVDGKPLRRIIEQPRHLIYNKPAGQICSRDDPEGRPNVFSALPKLRRGRWIAVGRLDFNTAGLLLFTTDGELASRLMHPSANIDREYAVRILGEVQEPQLEAMRQGVMLEDGLARFTDIRKGRDEAGANQWYYVVLMEGRNREVRRLFESQGLVVSRLKRVRFGSFFIPSGVKSRQTRPITGNDEVELYRMAGLEPPQVEKRGKAGGQFSPKPERQKVANDQNPVRQGQS
ncbi:MAG: pseudouridine synthase, partial [Pseudomonadales bacterium]